jgi:hypothetical protein
MHTKGDKDVKRARKAVATGLVLSLVVFSCGCASIFHGARQRVGISSSPSGATCTTGGVPYTTPAVLRLKRNRDHILVFAKPGYDDASSTVQSSWIPTILWNGVNIFGWIVDWATGASHELTPENVHVTLIPTKDAAK